jgi:hypothetical protein
MMGPKIARSAAKRERLRPCALEYAHPVIVRQRDTVSGLIGIAGMLAHDTHHPWNTIRTNMFHHEF